MNSLFVPILLVLLGACLSSAHVDREAYAKMANDALADISESMDDPANQEAAKKKLEVLELGYSGVDDAVYTTHKDIIDLLEVSRVPKYCLRIGLNKVHNARDLIKVLPANSKLSAWVNKLSENYANLCREQVIDSVIRSSDRLDENLTKYVTDLTKILDNQARKDDRYMTTSPFDISLLMNGNDFAKGVFEVIKLHPNDAHISQVFAKDKNAIQKDIVSSILIRYIIVPCEHYTKTVEYNSMYKEFDQILGRATGEKGDKFNDLVTNSSYCKVFVDKNRDEEEMKTLLSRVITAETGKKVKMPGGGLFSCFGSSCVSR